VNHKMKICLSDL